MENQKNLKTLLKTRHYLFHFREWIEMHGLLLLRLSVGMVFLWFGFLKFFPGNAAESLASDTISWLTGGWAGKTASLYFLGTLECIIGLAVLSGKGLTVAIPLLYLQMTGTLLPLFVFPEKTWMSPFMPSLEGQYIIKNAVFIASGILIGAMARGSKLITHPGLAKAAKRKEKALVENKIKHA